MGVAMHRPDLLLVLHVPNLDLAVQSANRQVAAALAPGDGGHLVDVTKVDQLANA